MTEGIVIFFLALGLLNRKLQLALNFPHEEIVNDDIVGRCVHLIPDLDDFELLLHGLAGVQQVHRFENTDKGVLVALELRPDEIVHSKVDQIEVLLALVCHNPSAGSEEMVNEKICVVKHQGS